MKYITCYDYRDLCDYIYEDQNDLPAGIVSVDIQKCPEFFRKIENNSQEYVVVSCASDYMLCEQEYFPVYNDMYKSVRMFIKKEQGYAKGITFPARCELDQCDINDRYSIKCYMHTSHTFNNIPENVKRWFLTNNVINDSRLENIPFGVQGQGSVDNLISAKQKSRKRQNKIYACWQFYTNERWELFYNLNESGIDCITTEHDVSQEHFYEQLLAHDYVFCPIGNGIDCYRIYEALYLGCTPIIEYHPGLMFLRTQLQLPVIFVNYHYMYNPRMNEINAELQKITYVGNTDHSLSKLNLDYWRNRIRDCCVV